MPLEHLQRILILGATGLLGSAILSNRHFSGRNVVAQGRSLHDSTSVDLVQVIATHEMLDEINPEVIINLVSLTDVDQCEEFPNQAYIGNVRTVENVVAWISQSDRKIHYIHISTDQVYDGLGPHDEQSVTLTNYYAFSKYAGELLASTVRSTVLRTNFFGKSLCYGRSSLSDWIFQSLQNQSEIRVFEDVMFSPLFMGTLVDMIGLVVDKQPVGVFNLGAADGLSKADFAFQFAEQLSLPTETMLKAKTDNVSFLKTYRPKDMRMNIGKFERTLGVKLPSLADEIINAAKEYHYEA